MRNSIMLFNSVNVDGAFKVVESSIRTGMGKLRISKFLMYSLSRVVRRLRPAMHDTEFS